MARQRLHKYMAACGVGSRRECESIIAQGRVEVDGQVVREPGTQVDPDHQEVRCDASRLSLPRPVYLLLNKPRGVICSERSQPGMPRAVDFVPPEVSHLRLFTIGRLDVESEGALLLTNDGELCHLVTHPSFRIEKTYRVEIEGRPDPETLARMRRGVWLAEGRTSSLSIRAAGRRGGNTVLEVRLQEGMRREIRRVCARFGFPVRRLKRVAIGPIRLDRQPVGTTRELAPSEVAALRDSAEVVVRLGGTDRQRARQGRGRRSRGRPGAAGGTGTSGRPGRRAARGTSGGGGSRQRPGDRGLDRVPRRGRRGRGRRHP